MSYLQKIFNFGVANKPFSSGHKIRLTNIVCFFSFVASGLYTLNYLLILNQPKVAAINTLFTLAYLGIIWLNYFDLPRFAKVSFFSLLMLHLVVCTNVYVTNKTGFHLYFFLVPTGAYLLFDLKDKYEKLILSLIATVLFFYCENTYNENPLIVLNEQMNHMIYQSVVFINMIEVIFVLTLFVNHIERNELKLYHQAQTDSLTGIANRRHFFEQVENELTIANDQKRPYSLVMFDLDHFKRVNDQFGHQAGDICLQSLIKAVNSVLRETDFLARIGGEEFVIGMAETTINEANNIAERIRTKIQNSPVTVNDDQQVNCTASFGIANLTFDAYDAKSILMNADKALYQAKANGRNRVQLFEPDEQAA